MIAQRIEHPPLKGWRGVALILVIAAGVVALSNLCAALERVIGSLYASLLFILSGMGVAGFLLNWYVLGFLYAMDGSRLRVSRVYGRRERPMADIWLNSIQACGAPDDMRRRFPGARVHRAVKQTCPLAPMAVAYRDAGRAAILVIQPNDELRQALVRAVKG